MPRKPRFLNSFFSILLILSLMLMNVNVALADEGPTPEPAASAEPTEEPIQPTVEPTDPPVIATEPPVIETPVPTEAVPTETAPPTAEEAPIAELLNQAPENTDLVVLDENGQALPLTSQEALNTILETDPMWCPAGVLPGGLGCTTNFATISLLMADMANFPGTYDENGIIYFTTTPGASFTLTSATLSTFETLNDFNLTLQGGWNGLTGASATFTGQTNFGSNTLTIGSSANPWAGNISLSNFGFNGVSTGAAVTVYTTGGSITLNNVDVTEQTNGTFTATLNSISGNITVQNGSTFDGNSNKESQGFSATTGSGAITISDTIFSDSRKSGNQTYDGATLSALTVTLTNVISQNNDGDGITINNANIVTLNNVTATGNGTESGVTGLSNNDGSGVFINGNPASSVYINAGTFTNNQEYGVEVANPSNTTIYIQSNPGCTGNDSNEAPTSNCYNDTTISDSTGPVITPTISGTAGSNGWYTSNVSVSWSVTDAESNIASSTGCTTSSLSSDTTGTSLTCSATNHAGLSSSNSVTIKIDKTFPTITYISRTPANANGWNTTNVTINWSCTDVVSGVVSAAVNQTVTAEGSNQAATGTCQDLAGNSATNTQSGINIDKNAPTTIASVSPAANANGWNNSDVTVSFTGSDAASGIATCSPSVAITAEGAGQTSSSGTCTDLAGNTSSPVSANGINIDRTSPVIAFANSSPAPNLNGWNNGNVTVHWSCADSLSGPVSGSVSQTISVEGANQSATGTCQDLAGNSASSTQSSFNLDKTAPTLTLPSNMTVEATDSAGAVVVYAVSATDSLDGAPSVGCTPLSGSTFVIGTTMVNCTATDQAGNTGFGNFNITVQDSEGPVIAFHADVTAEATSGSGSDVSYASPTTSDDVDGSGVAVCTPASGTLFATGDTTITCTATDSNGNTATPTTFVIHVVDTTAPVITALSDVTVEATSASGATVNYTNPNTSDAVDGSGTASCSPPSGGTFILGETTVTCTAIDSHGNVATPITFDVHVVDTTAPVIAAHADITAEATSAAGASVTYSNPTTSDIVDGAGVATCVPASGSTFPLGDTTISCKATDTHNNAAAPISFVVHVIDTTAPVITAHADVFVAATSLLGAIVNYTSPSTTDAVDGTGSATCAPPPGSQFPIGNTTVTCDAIDSHGNQADSTSFVVHVLDTAAPVIDGHLDETVEATSAAGAVATYTSPATSDAVDGAGVATCAPASGTFFVFGNTTVTCNATDSNGNAAAPTSFVVHVVDTTAPVIASHTDVSVVIDNNLGAIVTYSSPATSDIVDGSGIATCSPSSGSFFSVGGTVVTCNASDSHGNPSQPVIFTVQVVFQSGASVPTPVAGSQEPVAESQESGLSIPVTSGLLDLECLTLIDSFGIKVTFHNLCDHQAAVTEAASDTLPAQLPEEYFYVQGLNVLVLLEHEVVKALPEGTGVQLDFPIPANTQDEYDVLLWEDKDGDGEGEWLKVTRLVLDQDLSKVLSADPNDELYQIAVTKTLEGFYRIITTEKTGTFVLVKK